MNKMDESYIIVKHKKSDAVVCPRDLYIQRHLAADLCSFIKSHAEGGYLASPDYSVWGRWGEREEGKGR